MNTIENKESNLVSIITPAYNSAEYVSECINSVLNQKYKNWEMIIVDDKSTDNTLSIIRDFEKKDHRIKVISLPNNVGVAHARNKALSVSKGRFIAFLDSDDLWTPDKLDKQIQFMLNNGYGFTFTSYEIKKDKVKYKKNKIFKSLPRISYKEYLKNTNIGNLTVVMDKEIIGDIRVEEGELEDVLTWMKYLKKGFYAYGLDEILAVYRVSKNSISSNKISNARKYFYCLRKKQKLTLVYSIYCQIGYMFNASVKRLK